MGQILEVLGDKVKALGWWITLKVKCPLLFLICSDSSRSQIWK